MPPPECLCSEPFYVSASVPITGIDWQVRPPLPGLAPSEKQSLNKTARFNTSIANLVTLRGKDVQSADLGKKLGCVEAAEVISSSQNSPPSSSKVICRAQRECQHKKVRHRGP